MPNRLIILVDDDDDDCFLFENAIQEIGSTARLTTANSYQDLLDILAQLTIELPILILMDLNLPGLNGIECLERLKDTEAFKHIPVIIFSTCSHRNAIDEAYNCGAFHFIAKPCSFEILKAIAMKVTTMNLRETYYPHSREQFYLEF